MDNITSLKVGILHVCGMTRKGYGGISLMHLNPENKSAAFKIDRFLVLTPSAEVPKPVAVDPRVKAVPPNQHTLKLLSRLNAGELSVFIGHPA